MLHSHGARLIALALLVALTACHSRVSIVTEPVGPVRSEPVPSTVLNDWRTRFGQLFCAVLNHKADAGSWNYCAAYIKPSGTPSTLSPNLKQTYRVLVIPGIFGQCVEGLARPFADAAAHLRDVHSFDVEYLSVSALGSSEYNAAQITNYLRGQFTGADQRPYILFGYSKGASDILEALRDDFVRTRVKAVVTIAGAVLGSRLTTGVMSDLLNNLQNDQIGTCGIGDGKGLDSLHRARAVEAVASLTLPADLRRYSIAAVSTQDTTSRALARGWRQLQAYSLKQDSQMIHEDAILPGATYLGMALGDHWAVALPFELAQADPVKLRFLRRFVDHNHYPRSTLFEAALRYVLGELP